MSTSQKAKLLIHPNTIPTPALPTPGVFTIHSSVSISAPPKTCLTATISPSTWSKWNPFVPSITINSPPPSQTTSPLDTLSAEDPTGLKLGTKFSMRVYMDGSGLSEKKGSMRENPEMVTCLEEIDEGEGNGRGGKRGYRVAWAPPPGVIAGGSWLMRCERVQEFIDDGKGGTNWETWETFHGPLAYIVKWFVGAALVDRFNDWGNGLKSFCEGEG